MSMPMTDEQIARTAAFYDIDATEARRRYEVCQAHTGDPEDPICVGCAKRPAETSEYDYLIFNTEDEAEIGFATLSPEELAEERRKACIREEGTLNPENGHYLCNSCYLLNNQPSSPRGWKCP